MTASLDIVNLFLRTTNSANADVDAATQLMTEDVQFIGPLMRTSGRGEYAALLRQFLPAHVDTRALRQFADGDEVCSIDQLAVRSPGGATITLELAEWFRLRDGRIAEHRIYYDPREFAAAFGMGV